MDVKEPQRNSTSDTALAARATRIAWIVAGVYFALYVYLAWRNPAVYWYDSTDRLALRDRLLVGHWLPLVQAIIFLISRATRDLLVVRLALAAIAGLSIVAMDCLASRLFGAQTGPVSAVLLASNLLFVALAIVPYPDVLFVGLMLTALYYLSLSPSRNHVLLGMLALNLACLTRYEGWILAGLIAMAAALRFARQLAWSEMRRFAATVALTALTPVTWLILGVNTSGGLLSSLATVVGFEQDRLNAAPFLPMIDPEYVGQFALNFLHLLSWQLGIPLLAAGLLGWLLAVRLGRNRSVHILIAVFCLLDLALLAFWRPWPFDNLRQTFIVLVFLILYAGNAIVEVGGKVLGILSRIGGSPRWTTIRNWGVASVAVWTVLAATVNAARFVTLAAEEPEFAVPAQAGTWIGSHLQPGDSVWVVSAQVFPAYALAAYSGLTYDSVLDARADAISLKQHVARGTEVYVVDLPGSHANLAATDAALVLALDHGELPAERCPVNAAAVWKVRSGSLLQWLASR